MRRCSYFKRTRFRCATLGKTSCGPRTERLGGNKKETNRIPVLLLMMIVMRKVISFLLRIPPHQSRNPGWRGLRGTRAPHRRASPEGGHPPKEGIPPRYPHATPELPGVSSVRAAALTGETPPARRGNNKGLANEPLTAPTNDGVSCRAGRGRAAANPIPRGSVSHSPGRPHRLAPG